MKLSVCLLAVNEEANIERCLEAVKPIADEMIVFIDNKTTDKTSELAQKMGARVTVVPHVDMFHINKQKAIDACKGDWILQLDADEVVSKELADEIVRVMDMDKKEIEEYQLTLKKRNLFLRYQKIIDEQRGTVGDQQGEFVAFYMPRANYFLGHFMKFGGVYPDGVIRLWKRGKAYLPCKDVHELPVVKGRVGWLQNDLLHYDSPTFSRYIARNKRYIDMIADEYRRNKLPKTPVNFVDHMFLKPLSWFFMTQIRHKGILDGPQGVIFSFFSALRFPRAFLKYLKKS
jgi:glycosyltransferase involved in cell wall biosynthesis